MPQPHALLPFLSLHLLGVQASCGLERTRSSWNIHVSLPQGWIQEIKLHVACSSCEWFIFNLNTVSCNLQIIYYSTCTSDEIRSNPTPGLLSPFILLTWRTSFLLVARIPIHSCPWFANNWPPIAASLTLSHPTDQVTIFT